MEELHGGGQVVVQEGVQLRRLVRVLLLVLQDVLGTLLDAPDLPAHLLIVNVLVQLADLCQQLGVLVGGFFLRRLLFFHALESIGI